MPVGLRLLVARTILVCLLCACGLFLCATLTNSIPDEPPIIVYDTSSSWFSRSDTVHHLQVWSDGTVLADDPYGRCKAATGRVPIVEVEELLTFLIDEQDLPTIPYAPLDSIKRAMSDETGMSSHIFDSGTQRIRVRVADGEYDVSVYAARGYLLAYPEIEEYGRFIAAVDRLKSVRARVMLGGVEVVDRYLDVVNGRLASDHPSLTPLERIHLRSACQPVDGAWQRVTFSRSEWIHPDTSLVVFADIVDSCSVRHTFKLSVKKHLRELSVRERAKRRNTEDD